LGASLLCLVSFTNSSRMHVAHYENVLGTSLEIKTAVATDRQAAMAEETVLKEVERLSKILSGYDNNSEFSQWMKTSHQAVHISKELFTVLSLFDQWRGKTSGALDPSAELINQVWKKQRVNLPSHPPTS